MKYFTIKELCYSDTAKKYKIDNSPSEEIIEHLTEMVETLLDPLRESWGSAIKVNSGYRCPSLNNKVGGSKGSSHMIGYAVDLRPSNRKTAVFFEFVKNYLIENDIPFDQLIDERSCGTRWVHIGYKNSKGKQRREIKLYDNGKYCIIKKAEENKK